MDRIVPIVEGDGEVAAVPILLRRLLAERDIWNIGITRPKNAHGRGNLLKMDGIERFVQLAWNEPGCSGVLVLLDAEEECPRALAAALAARVNAVGVRRSVAVVCAKCEYEAWFLTSLPAIAAEARLQFPPDLDFSGDVEAIVGVKGWLSRQLPKTQSYSETRDQPAMTQWLDLDEARRRSRSFRRLCRGVDELIADISSGAVRVTPSPG